MVNALTFIAVDLPPLISGVSLLGDVGGVEVVQPYGGGSVWKGAAGVAL